MLFADEAEAAETTAKVGDPCAFGFYWTEGTRGLGWAVDAIPTLKGGSSIGIPSPPAILLESREVVTPSIRDAERLQGFPTDWTQPAEEVTRKGQRWKLVGNAVSVPVAEWIGRRLRARNANCLSRLREVLTREPRRQQRRLAGQSTQRAYILVKVDVFEVILEDRHRPRIVFAEEGGFVSRTRESAFESADACEKAGDHMLALHGRDS